MVEGEELDDDDSDEKDDDGVGGRRMFEEAPPSPVPGRCGPRVPADARLPTPAEPDAVTVADDASALAPR